ncbi:unnamed protein product [Phytomonas sp. Hart1]|nr:unnamed protein product [Phytomonas sp. Hart1]|eukprot:CCW66193.1 unnamed protein product [Phytomonas sp. isolate Hart1]
MAEDSLCRALHARNLLGKSTPPPLELYVQLLGAGMCAALSRVVLGEIGQTPTPTTSPRVDPLWERRPKKATTLDGKPQGRSRLCGEGPRAGFAASVEGSQNPPGSSSRLPPHGDLLNRRVIESLQVDLSAHYGSHALRRGSAKPLGPAFRSKKALSHGIHEGRAQHIWRISKAHRQWCPRCGVSLSSSPTNASQTAPSSSTSTALYVDPIHCSLPSGPANKRVKAPNTVKVCARCFRLQSRRAVLKLKKDKIRLQTLEVQPLEKEKEKEASSGSAVSCSAMGPSGKQTKDISKEGNIMVGHHFRCITDLCKVKKRRRKRAWWSRRAAKKSSPIQMKTSASNRSVKTASTLKKASWTSSPAPQKLHFDIPKGPVRRGGVKSKPTPPSEPPQKPKPLLPPPGEKSPLHSKVPGLEVTKKQAGSKEANLMHEKQTHSPHGALGLTSLSATQSVLVPGPKTRKRGRSRGEVQPTPQAPVPAQQSSKRIFDMMSKLGF